MPSKPNPVPEDYPRLIPYLMVRGAESAIAFYKKALGATERMSIPGPDGTIGHAELQFGDSVLMLADEAPNMNMFAPAKYGGSPVALTLYVEDVDATVKRATDAGAKIVNAVEDKFYGDRAGTIEDPFGHAWHIMTHVKDVPPEEMERLAEQAFAEST